MWALPDRAATRAAFVASKRVGKAVIRNRAKRWMREIFRRHQLELTQAYDLVFVARSRLPGATHSQVEAEMMHHLRRLGCIDREDGTAVRTNSKVNAGQRR